LPDPKVLQGASGSYEPKRHSFKKISSRLCAAAHIRRREFRVRFQARMSLASCIVGPGTIRSDRFAGDSPSSIPSLSRVSHVLLLFIEKALP